MIHTRFDNGAAAELLLEIWQRQCTNEGQGTLHDTHFPGVSMMGCNYEHRAGRGGGEIMQMDAGMSCTAAIQEMLLHTRRGVTHVFAGTPQAWADVSFARMRTDGAFLVSASRHKGRTEKLVIASLAGGVLQLANPWAGGVCVRYNDGKTKVFPEPSWPFPSPPMRRPT